jgi:hypothetical protein
MSRRVRKSEHKPNRFLRNGGTVALATVVGMTRKSGGSPIKLFRDQNPHQLMRQSHGAETDKLGNRRAPALGDAIGATDNESGRQRGIAQLPQSGSEIIAIEKFAALVKDGAHRTLRNHELDCPRLVAQPVLRPARPRFIYLSQIQPLYPAAAADRIESREVAIE